MKITIRYRNNGNSKWIQEKELFFDLLKEHDIIVSRNLGIYSNRQYEIVMTDDEKPLGIVTIEEEVTLIR